MNRIALGLMLSIFAVGAYAHASEAGDLLSDNASSDEIVVVAVEPGDAKKNDQRCVTETGSRIKHRDGKQCLAANGASYSHDDLDGTGGTDTGEALERLDPSLSTR